MRAHRDIAHARIIGQSHRDRRRLAAPGALQVDEVTDRAQMCSILAQRRDESALEGGGAVGLHQFDEAAGERGQVHTAFGGEREELRGTRSGVVQPVDCP